MSYMKIKQYTIITIAAATLLTGCASNRLSNTNKLSDGMTKQQIISILGNPESTASPGSGVEVLRYYLTYAFDGVGPGKEYFVFLKDGKLVQYGEMGDFNSTKNPTLDLNINKQ